MKRYYFFVVLFLLLGSCGAFQNSENKITNNYCTNNRYSDIGFYDCCHSKFHFDRKSFRELKRLNLEVFNENFYNIPKGIKQGSKSIESAFNSTGDTLIGQNGYGFYKMAQGSGATILYYFLRTESGLYFFTCYDKNHLYVKLDMAKKINDTLKVKIKKFIKQQCNGTKNGLLWQNGIRFY